MPFDWTPYSSRSKRLLEELMGPRRPAIWSEEPPVDLSPYGQIPSMIPPDYTGGPMATSKRTTGVVLEDPLKSIPTPTPSSTGLPAPVPVPVPAVKPAGWRNTITNILGDAIQGMAASPSGSVNDTFRGMAGTIEAGRHRQQLERQQRLEDEARKRQIEDRQRQLEDRQRQIELAKQQIEESKSRTLENEAQRKQIEEKVRRGELVPAGNGRFYNPITKDWIVAPPDPPKSDTPEGRDALVKRKYEEAVKSGNKAQIARWDPNSEKNIDFILFGSKAASSVTGGRYGIIARGDPAEMARLNAYDTAEMARRRELRNITLQAARAQGMTPRQEQQLVGEYNDEDNNLQSGLNRLQFNFNNDMGSLARQYAEDPDGLEAAKKPIVEAFNRDRDALITTHSNNIARLDRTVGQRLRGVITPAAPAAGTPAAPAAPAAPANRRWARDEDGNVVYSDDNWATHHKQ